MAATQGSEPVQDDDRLAIVVDDKPYTLDDLTFREQRKMRGFIRDWTGDQTIEPGDATLMDFLPAMVAVIRQREDANYNPDQALDEKLGDVLKPDPTDPNETDPTPSTPEDSGNQQTS